VLKFACYNEISIHNKDGTVLDNLSKKKHTNNKYSGLLELLRPVDTNPFVLTRQNLIFDKIKKTRPPENTDNKKKPQTPDNPRKNKNATEVMSSNHNTTGIPAEAFYQLGNYLFQQARKSNPNHAEQKKPAKLHIIENYFNAESIQPTQGNDSARHHSFTS